MRVLAAATPGMEIGVLASGRWPETGVFWPIMVAAAADTLGTMVMGPGLETSGWANRSSASSWQLW